MFGVPQHVIHGPLGAHYLRIITQYYSVLLNITHYYSSLLIITHHYSSLLVLDVSEEQDTAILSAKSARFRALLLIITHYYALLLILTHDYSGLAPGRFSCFTLRWET